MTKDDQAGWATLSMNTSSVDNPQDRKEYTLSTTKDTIIGRSPDCQIALDPHKFITVSRRHAQIKLVDVDWQITDLGTTNGTLINDRPINNPQQLQSGDRITLGSKGPEFTFACQTLNATVMVEHTILKVAPSQTAKPKATPKLEPKPASNNNAIAEAKQTIPASPEAKLSVAQSVPKPEARKELEPKQKANPVKEEAPPLAAVNANISEIKATPPVVENKQSPTPSQVPVVNSGKSLWSLVSISQLGQISGHSQPILSLAFSPDGQILASTSKDKTIKLWSIAQRTEIATLTGHKLAPNAIAFSPDGKTLASGGADKTIKLWDINTYSETASFIAHKLAINAIVFSPDGKIASGGADKTIKLWDINTHSETASFTAHKLAIESLAFSPDGQTLASGSRDKTIKLWQVASQSEIATLTGYKQGISAIGFSPDGQILASAGLDQTIKLCHHQTQTEIATIAIPSGQTGAIAISPDGQTIAGSDQEGAIKLWQI
ncbi:MAG: FHA domain-containing protein [Cyanobacteria bacterium P01_G01_bin.39]